MFELPNVEVENTHLWILGGTLVTGAAIAVIVLVSRRSQSKETYPPNTVVLHQITRGPYAPSFSPFVLKLETFLRAANIPYQNSHIFKSSPKGKFPWIEFNGQVISDSDFCIQFLNKQFDVDLNKGLSEEEKAMAYAFQKMFEENTYWVLIMDRWVLTSGSYKQLSKAIKLPSYMMYLFKRSLSKMVYAHGMGRHNEEEVYEIFRGDLSSFSVFLGNKKFLLGDRPCQADFGIFGQLAQFYWQCFGTRTEKTMKEFPNLCRYCETMKMSFWPDWDECTTRGGTTVATK